MTTDTLPPRPDWLRLGAVVSLGGRQLAVVGIRPAGAVWEIMGPETANEWIPACDLVHVEPPPVHYRPWGQGDHRPPSSRAKGGR